MFWWWLKMVCANENRPAKSYVLLMCWVIYCFVWNKSSQRVCHVILIIATSVDNFLWRFFILRGTSIVNHGIDFVTLFRFGSDKKWVSQISDIVRIVTKFVTKKYVFVTEYILWLTLGVDRIFVTRTSQNANYNENNHFCNINRTSPNVKSLVVKV